MTISRSALAHSSLYKVSLETLLVENNLLRYDPKMHTYRATKKGRIFLRAYSQIDKMLRNPHTVTVQDTAAPDVEITQATDKRNRVLEEGDTTPTPYIRITFEATDAVGVENTECSLDGQQPFTSCTNPVVYDRLSRGTHQVTVRATDEAGNTGEDRFLFTVGSPSSSVSAPGGQ